VTPDGKMSTVLQDKEGWAPTGVAAYDHDVFVLEFQNAGSGNRKQWTPRIRRLAADGKVTVMGTVNASSHK
jgi:hypothetical protein